MKNYDDERLLAHKRSVDAHRKGQAILRRRHQQRINAQAIVRIAEASVVQRDRDMTTDVTEAAYYTDVLSGMFKRPPTFDVTSRAATRALGV